VLRVLILALCLGCGEAHAVPITFLVTPPSGTTGDATIHLAGDFQGWRPGDPDWQLEPTGDGRFVLTADFAHELGLQFKLTMGSWLTVEKGPGGVEIANRLHVVSGPDTLRLEVVAWADGQEAPRADTLTGRVETITVPGFLDGRRVWLYLPPDYDLDTSRRYPVLYMFDGQNVFNEATSFVGEWQVDETIESLLSAGRITPLIVVAVDNGGDRRTGEYTPWSSPHYSGSGGGRDHLRHWIEILLPYINSHYRTQATPAQTGLAGSSLGGLMSLYGGFARPEIFGKIGVFSPTLHVTTAKLHQLCAEQSRRLAAVYMDMGTREAGNFTDHDHNGTDDAIDALRRMQDVLQARGYVGGWDLLVVEDAGGRHHESAWARRFPAAVEFLFPPE
jgi:pullulanase